MLPTEVNLISTPRTALLATALTESTQLTPPTDNSTKGYGIPFHAGISAREECIIRDRVQGNLKWMGARFIGFKIKKKYRDIWYQGCVRRVGWHRERGYRATVVYEDGYVETIPVATLVRLHKRKERETGLMHERYVGVTFEKAFGELGVFSGVVREVWRHDNGTYQA